ncbi:LOW QUALITY PROTEIN: G-type lectin S-receptor-like serine/threonine-protein kinase SD2-5 [Eucalyptus grandis]|uniref:LOW QUALITY PROTEIN: G-type lectin S-receptor-like serine/threonine-protein kinase SD2-5 n=1 Tax=Eucalyptus grandis TaxID=71139 RepID=UPI00192EB20C|nr:LOW QUALITY PROTEIN: G-type lectin S-receptor-like serine/threonine-protein kinase SD2-5 [Eucalyptus grandis]
MTNDASVEVVWSTNRNNPVKINATLELTSKGNLVLKDAGGTIAWSTNTSGKSVVGLNLTDLGNLVLFDKNNVTVWQSFDHPTDTLVLGQKLMAGQRLIPSVSETNWAIDGTLMLYMNGRGLFAQIETSPPQIYYQSLIDNPNANTESPYVEFINGSLAFFSNSIHNLSLISVPHASFVQYMKLGSDGHLRVYELSYRPNWSSPEDMCAVWAEVADLLTMSLAGDCGYPKFCLFGREISMKQRRNILLKYGMLTRFRFGDLKAMTNDFSKKLGECGFGSVFEGTLIDGTKVAVKRLGGFGQVKKSFLAEVETIGGIHHVNLVRLMGYCAEKSQRLLIYEYMSNGALDRWIFPKSNECVLGNEGRIILDIAKGLDYLHEDCRQKIVHLDIKPQNILLDGNFNAKVADFGLSKLIERGRKPSCHKHERNSGYLAPEWLNVAITEKVDVYSFGVVILEIVCGRKNFDRSLDEEDMYLLSLLKRKAEEKRLLDIVDKSSEDMRLNGPHAVNMMRIAAWCLQGDYTMRPSMSMIIKVLEGVMKVPDNLNYNFSAQLSTKGAAKLSQEISATTALSPFVLTGA